MVCQEKKINKKTIKGYGSAAKFTEKAKYKVNYYSYDENSN
jgi:hypothetical protein